MGKKRTLRVDNSVLMPERKRKKKSPSTIPDRKTAPLWIQGLKNPNKNNSFKWYQQSSEAGPRHMAKTNENTLEIT